ncbi:MAG: Uma2 family endonuclease [Planctomycetes bacterium]|nr:Uma2 family endonuclease [Planctomycetota bacterium]
MSSTTAFTADQLLALPTGMGKRYELVLGELRVMSPSGWRHGAVVGNLDSLLASFIRTHDLGRGFGAETGFLLQRKPDTVRAPDFAFISNAHLPKTEPKEAFWPGAPDLAVEVLSPDDRKREVKEKVNAWLSAGCAAVWVVDPELQTVTIYQSPTNVQVKKAGETLTGDPVVPGFSCPVAELFR